jgi:hypothetical protein
MKPGHDAFAPGGPSLKLSGPERRHGRGDSEAGGYREPKTVRRLR